MTTNSPNPVDCDVQALIADCEAEIVELEKRLTTWGEAWIPYLQSKLRRQQIALAALTAEPYAYASRNTDMRKESQYFSASIFNNAWGYEYTLPLYTTPPVQLLRPVELPQSFYGVVQDGKAVMLPANDGQWLNKTAVIEALRKQGYEVK